jgi:hypothetical protein
MWERLSAPRGAVARRRARARAVGRVAWGRGSRKRGPQAAAAAAGCCRAAGSPRRLIPWLGAFKKEKQDTDGGPAAAAAPCGDHRGRCAARVSAGEVGAGAVHEIRMWHASVHGERKRDAQGDEGPCRGVGALRRGVGAGRRLGVPSRTHDAAAAAAAAVGTAGRAPARGAGCRRPDSKDSRCVLPTLTAAAWGRAAGGRRGGWRRRGGPALLGIILSINIPREAFSGRILEAPRGNRVAQRAARGAISGAPRGAAARRPGLPPAVTARGGAAAAPPPAAAAAAAAAAPLPAAARPRRTPRPAPRTRRPSPAAARGCR